HAAGGARRSSLSEAAAAGALPAALRRRVCRPSGRGGCLMSGHLDPTDLDAMLKRLHLPTVRRLYPELALRAEAEGMSYRGFLEILISEEIEIGRASCRERV